MIKKMIVLFLTLCYSTCFALSSFFPIGSRLLCAFSDEPDGLVLTRQTIHVFSVRSGGAETDYFRSVLISNNRIEMVRAFQGNLDGSSMKVDENEWYYLQKSKTNTLELSSKKKDTVYPRSRPCQLIKQTQKP